MKLKVRPSGRENQRYCIYCFPLRKVQLENSSGSNVDSQKMKLVLAVKAEKFEVDLVACCLRVNGKNIKENKHVKVTLQCVHLFLISLSLSLLIHPPFQAW